MFIHHNMLLLTNTLYSIMRVVIRVVYDVFVASWGDGLGVDWYHMYIGVVSRRIAWNKT